MIKHQQQCRTICNCSTFVNTKLTIWFWSLLSIGLSFRVTIFTQYYAWLWHALKVSSLMSHLALRSSRGWKLKAISHCSLGSTSPQNFTKQTHSYNNWNEVQSGTSSAVSVFLLAAVSEVLMSELWFYESWGICFAEMDWVETVCS